LQNFLAHLASEVSKAKALIVNSTVHKTIESIFLGCNER